MVSEAAAAAGDGEDDGNVLAVLSAGALVQDAAARGREVAVKLEEGNREATEAELGVLPAQVLSLDDEAGGGARCRREQ